MLMRKLGRTGLRVAALCLGGNTFGWTTDQKASEAVLDAYLEAGGNFIDTADVYARWAPGNKGGESEEALGTWMSARRNRSRRAHRDQGHGPDGARPQRHRPVAPSHRGGGRGLAAAAADRLHRPLPGPLGRSRDPARRDAARLRRPRGSGQGALSRRLELPRLAAHPRPLGERQARLVRYESLQPKYNLVFRDEYERELEPLCLEQGVGIIPYSSSAAASSRASIAAARIFPDRAPPACRRAT